MATAAKFWDNLAEDYAKKPVEDQAAFDRKIAITRSHLRPTDTVLDVGCGTGSFALILAPDVAHAHGMDLSPGMIRIANRKREAGGVDNVTFHVLTLDDALPFAPGSLDMVTVYSLFHLLEDRAGALRKIFELLRPGGTLVTSTVCLGGSWVPYGLLIGTMKLLGKAPDVYIFSHADWEDQIRAAGFVDVASQDVGAKKMISFVVAKKPA